MSAVAGVASIILLARFMDVSSYAAYATVTGLTFMAGTLSSLGIERAIARYVPEGRLYHAPDALAKLIWGTSLVRFAIASLLAFLCFVFWQYIDTHFFAKIPLGQFSWAVACYVLANTVFQHMSAVMQALVLQKTLTRILVVQWGGRLGLILVLIASNSSISLQQSLWIMAGPELIGAVILIWAVHHHLSTLNRDDHASNAASTTVWPPWREVREMALRNYGYNLLTAPPQGYFMRLFAAAVLPVPFVAAYGFFLSLGERVRPYLPLQLMYGLAEPVLIAGYVKDNDFEKLCLRTQFLFKANLILLVPLLVWLAVVSADFTSLLTGGKFTEYAWLLVLIIGQLMVGSHAVTSQLVLNAVGQSHILLKSGVFSLLVMGMAVALAVSSGHWVYVVFSPLIYSTANNGYIVLALRRHRYAYELPWVDILKIAASGCVAGLAVLPIVDGVHSPLERVILAGGVGLIVYLLALMLLRAIGAGDRQIMQSMLRRGASV